MSNPAEMPADPSQRRALIIFYDDATNTIEMEDGEFSYLEVPELLRAAMDLAEFNAPVPADLYETEEEE
jgi:hypothetical protein